MSSFYLQIIENTCFHADIPVISARPKLCCSISVPVAVLHLIIDETAWPMFPFASWILKISIHRFASYFALFLRGHRIWVARGRGGSHSEFWKIEVKSKKDAHLSKGPSNLKQNSTVRLFLNPKGIIDSGSSLTTPSWGWLTQTSCSGRCVMEYTNDH